MEVKEEPESEEGLTKKYSQPESEEGKVLTKKYSQTCFGDHLYEPITCIIWPGTGQKAHQYWNNYTILLHLFYIDGDTKRYHKELIQKNKIL